METDGINALNTSPDSGGILPPRIDAPGPLASYFTRPMVPSPASRRRDALKGIAQFIPFLSGEIAKYDDDKLGIALSSLDALGPAGTTLKGAAIIGKQAAKKGVGSLDQPKDMMFVHNTSEEAIKSFDEMGGIPSPSLAVQPTDEPLKGFGDIQLIARPKNFDPAADPRNAVYSADAYTPRAPKKIRLAKEGAAEQLAKDYKDFIEEGKDGGVQKLAIENLQKLKKNRGATILENSSYSFDSFFTNTTVARKKFLKDQNLDPKDFIDDIGLPKPRFPERKYRDWVRKEKDKYLSQEGVFTYFDDFEETMVTKPYTLENATENMIKETQRGGESASTAFGPASIRALMTRRFDDLADIKSERSRLGNTISSEGLGVEISDLLDVYDFPDVANNRLVGVNMLNDIGIALQDGKKLDEDLLKNAYNQNIDFDEVQKYTSTGGFEYDNPPKGFLDDLEKIFVDNATKNVNYFEAKPMRAVGFDEFAGAIVPPKTSKKVIDILENRGLKVIKNDPETDFFKTKARQKFKDQMFSFAPIVGAGGIAALTIDDNTPDENKGVGSLN